MAAILAGASGYVLKRVKSTDLVDNIRRVGHGESLLDPAMTERLFQRLRNGPKDDPLLSKRTSQERVIVEHIAAGQTNKQIADEMFLAEKTVKNYVSNLLTKMGMSRPAKPLRMSPASKGSKKVRRHWKTGKTCRSEAAGSHYVGPADRGLAKPVRV